jgi:gas vesicle protein
MEHDNTAAEAKGSSLVGFLSASFMAGMIAGVAVGMLVAPKPGKEARGLLKEQFSTVRNKVMRRRKEGLIEAGAIESATRVDYLH